MRLTNVLLLARFIDDQIGELLLQTICRSLWGGFRLWFWFWFSSALRRHQFAGLEKRFHAIDARLNRVKKLCPGAINTTTQDSHHASITV